MEAKLDRLAEHAQNVQNNCGKSNDNQLKANVRRLKILKWSKEVSQIPLISSVLVAQPF